VALTFVDLFAGCGGLSLGLEQAGFEPVFVNELSPDAMETYLENRENLAVDLRSSSRHCNDIFEITQTPARLNELSSYLRAEHGELGLVVGGPPCQGYSGIGHRRTFSGLAKKEIPSNHLYREMARVVESLQPRAFIFENVKGLLSARWHPEGDKGEIWEDVQRAFASIGGTRAKKQYSIGSALVLAKDYGVPQNRPRVLLIGIREDISWSSGSRVAGGRVPDAVGGAPDLVDLLGDLVDPAWATKRETTAYPNEASTDIQKALRRKGRGRVAKMGAPLTEMEYSAHRPEITTKFQYMLDHDGRIPPSMQTKKFAQRVLPARWGANGPSITATSLPDDYVHFSQPRVPTVREWARLQMFPDWYSFAGKRTTGGRRRAGDPGTGDWTREVPKYTQIGNAVPVGLARAVGRHLATLIE
jgi:DNA (cytosine-5)-methyltransferase 1